MSENWEVTQMDLRELLRSIYSPGEGDVFLNDLDRSDIGTVRDESGRTLLHCCAIRGDEAHSIATTLLNSGSDPVAADDDGWTPLDIAVSGGARQLIQLFVSRGAPYTLHAAAMLGSIDDVKACLDRGDDIDGEDKERRTPLTVAAGEGYSEIARILLSLGATCCPSHLGNLGPMGRALNGESASMQVENAPRDYDGVLRLLIEHGAAINVWVASALDLEEELLGLIESGSDLEAAMDGFWNRSPIHYAAMWGAPRTTGLLVQRGVNVNVMDMGWETSLDLAEKRGHLKVADVLTSHGGVHGTEARIRPA